jgi:hypothetical protein
MRQVLNATMALCITTLAACSNLSPAQQTQIQQALTVACNVDGAVVPIAQPVVATLGPGGATAASMDTLLVHPAVVAACDTVHGTPVSVVPVSTPTTPAATPAN